MNRDFEKVREIIRQLAEICEGMWIERESMRHALIHVCGVNPEVLEESMKIAKTSPEMKADARKAFAGMWASLQDESLEIVVEELMKELSKNDMPN